MEQLSTQLGCYFQLEKTKETIVSIYVVVQSTQENTHTKFISLKLGHMLP